MSRPREQAPRARIEGYLRGLGEAERRALVVGIAIGLSLEGEVVAALASDGVRLDLRLPERASGEEGRA